ncbi:MAG: tRNA (adenosine(37)-N6)-threonylcarbamoyltransferase complex dimerization subunit type 1 TsaB [Calditrichia bacterium]
MMNKERVLLLGIESSGLTSAISVGDGTELLGEIRLNKAHVHSKRMPVMLSQLLEHLDLAIENLSGIVLSAGPGSFTGLRIGYSLAKGLAHASGLPIVEVPTLDVWALQSGEKEKTVLPVIDAHRGELFTAKYRLNGDSLDRLTEFELMEINNLLEWLDEPVTITGGDAAKLAEKLINTGIPAGSILPPPNAMPESWALLKIGMKKYAAGEFADMAHCEPMYLRAFKGVM